MGDLSIVSCLLIQASIYVSMDLWNPFFTLGYNPILCYFIVQSAPALATGSPSLLSGSLMFQLIWDISWPSPRTSCFSKKLSSFY